MAERSLARKIEKLKLGAGETGKALEGEIKSNQSFRR